MKISELAAELEVLRAEHGDLNVVYTNVDCDYGAWDKDPVPELRQRDGYEPYINL